MQADLSDVTTKEIVAELAGRMSAFATVITPEDLLHAAKEADFDLVASFPSDELLEHCSDILRSEKAVIDTNMTKAGLLVAANLLQDRLRTLFLENSSTKMA